MLASQKLLIGSFERVQAFLNLNPLPSAPVKFAERRTELDSILARLNVLAAEQSAGQREARDDSRRQAKARKALRSLHLKPIARIAKGVLPQDPDIQRSLAMPETKLATGLLLAVASGIRSTAAKYEQLFVDNGRPADFLARLDAAIEAVRRSVLGRAQNVGRHVGARAGLTQELQRGRRCVHMLDAMVLDAFEGRADVIAMWKVAKRVKEPTGPSVRATGGTADENVQPQQAA